MRVFRIETRHHFGPFRNPDPEYQQVEEVAVVRDPTWQVRNNHPAPWDDGLQMTLNEVSGVISIEQANQWFGTTFEHDMLTEFGYHLDEYEVKDNGVKIGGHQVAFDPTKAHLVKVHPISIMDK